jgi:hypothetical protein
VIERCVVVPEQCRGYRSHPLLTTGHAHIPAMIREIKTALRQIVSGFMISDEVLERC